MSPRSAKPSKGSSTKRTSSKPTSSRRATAAATPARQTAGPPGRGSGHASSHGSGQSSGRGSSASRGASASRSTSASAGKGARPGSERARDEKRSGGPRYAGEPWKVADERAGQRFGHARTDDADPSEVAPQDAESVDDDRPSVADPDLAAAEASGEIESGGRRTGMRRGEEPHRNKERNR